MRVCMLTYFYWPAHTGGAENQCRRLAAHLVQNGHNCRVLTGRHDITVPGFQKENGVTIIRRSNFETILQRLRIRAAYTEIGEKNDESLASEKKHLNEPKKSGGFVSSTAARVIRCCNVAVFSISVLLYILKNKRSIDILHVHTAEWIAGLAALAGRQANIPVVCKGANMPVFPPMKDVPLGTLLNNWRKKPYFIALTHAMKKDLLENGVVENKVTVIPNGVQLPSETAPVEQNEIFIYIGNFSQTAAHKGFDLLIKAWSIVHRQRPGARLIMLGGGEAGPWIDFANESGCDNSIQFAGYQNDLSPYYRSACCLLLPSRKEGVSNALLEAQSWGIPAVVSDIPGNSEVVVHEQTGLVIPVDNYVALAEASIYMLDEPLIRDQYGKAARRRMAETFAMEKVAQATVDLYEKVVSSQ